MNPLRMFGAPISNDKRAEWEAEAAHIAREAAAKHFTDFNDDVECFYRYCSMQSRAAARAGFQDIADRIQDTGSAAIAARVAEEN